MNKIKMTALFVLLIAGLAFSVDTTKVFFNVDVGEDQSPYFKVKVAIKGTTDTLSDGFFNCSGDPIKKGTALLLINGSWTGTFKITAPGYLDTSITKTINAKNNLSLTIILIKIPPSFVYTQKEKGVYPLTISNNSFTVEVGSYEITAFNLSGQLIFQKKAYATTSYTGLLPILSNNAYVVYLKQGNHSVIKKVQVVK